MSNNKKMYDFSAHTLLDNLTFVRVMSKPRMEVTIMIPTRMNEMCWDQNFTWHGKKK